MQLYVKRVFIMDKAAELLPPWLRFMRGLVDTADLPLNVSRELLQNNRTVEKIKSALVKRTLDLLEELAADKPQEYAEFWKTFGVVLKEGVIEDAGQKARIAKLLRFHSTASYRAMRADVDVSPMYVSRMKPDQKAIYYLTADTLAAARNSPHLEGFRQARAWRCCCSRTASTNGSRAICTSSRARSSRTSPSAAADVASAIETPEKAAAESAYKETVERLGKALLGKIASARRQRPADRFAGGAGRGRIRHEPAHGPNLEAGRPEQSVRDAADSGVESEACAGRATQGHRRRGGASPISRTCCTTRRCWPRAGSSMIRRFSFSASTSSSSRGSSAAPKIILS